MSIIARSIPVAGIALLIGTAQLAAQQPGTGDFQWYVGAQGGAMVFRTPSQTQGGIPMAGGHVLIVAHRTGLMVSVDEGIGSTELSSYNDGNGSVQMVSFNDIRKYSGMLMAFPLRSPIQPFLGVGVGIIHVVNPIASTLGGSSDIASELGSSGFGSFLGGLQFQLGRFMAFGQYQITTSPSVHAVVASDGSLVAAGRLLAGPTHSFSGGLRIGLGSARETARSGGY